MTNSKLEWKVEYKDGRVFTERDLSYKEIDRPQVSKFSIVRKVGGETVYSINILEGDNFVYRRRTAVDGAAKVTEVCHVVMRLTTNGNKFAFVFDNTGKLVIKDSFEQNTRWFYSPVFAGFETQS